MPCRGAERAGSPRLETSGPGKISVKSTSKKTAADSVVHSSSGSSSALDDAIESGVRGPATAIGRARRDPAAGARRVFASSSVTAWMQIRAGGRRNRGRGRRIPTSAGSRDRRRWFRAAAEGSRPGSSSIRRSPSAVKPSSRTASAPGRSRRWSRSTFSADTPARIISGPGRSRRRAS